MKTLKSMTLALMLLAPTFASSQPWEIESRVGYKSLPGRYFYKEVVTPYTSGSAGTATNQQGERNSRLHLLAARTAFLKSAGGMQYGMEAGLDFSLPHSRLEWGMTPTYNFTGTTRFPSVNTSVPSAQATLRNEITTIALPLLLRASLTSPHSNGLRVRGTFAFGCYLVNQILDSTLHFEYKQASGSYAPGDKKAQTTRDASISVVPILELRPELSFPLTNAVSLGLSGELGYLPEFGPSNGVDQSIRTEYEFGGLTYGGGFGLRFSF